MQTMLCKCYCGCERSVKSNQRRTCDNCWAGIHVQTSCNAPRVMHKPTPKESK